MKMTFEPNSEGQFVCAECGKPFDKEQGLRVHTVMKHRKKTQKTQSERVIPKKNSQAQQHLVRFCPCCGTNLHVVEVALNLGSK